MDQTRADGIARAWIDAWNAHDLERILSHYSERVEFTSPFVTGITGDPTGTLRGKPALRAYFSRALETYPALQFKLLHALPGVSSVALHYESINALRAVEVMTIGSAGEVERVQVHYQPLAP
ncbi:MAG: nuclear transport factor 2 family protein [Gemmatimonadota bacterium]